MRRLRTTLPWAVLVMVTGFAGCTRSTSPDAADRTFVAEMIGHHHIGMELIDDATLRSDDVRLRRMVFEMGTYHSSELEQLHTWAADWRVTPAIDFPGDIDDEELRRLSTTTGIEHDTLWLALMIEHHRGALVIADSRRDGAVESVRSMAESIHVVQSQEIAAMESLLTELCREAPSAPGCGQQGDPVD